MTLNTRGHHCARATDLTAKLSRDVEQFSLQVEEPGPVLLHGVSLLGAELLQDLLESLRDLLRLDGGLGDGATVEIMIPAVRNILHNAMETFEEIVFRDGHQSHFYPEKIWKCIMHFHLHVKS